MLALRLSFCQVISTSFASTRVAGLDAYISAVNDVDLVGKMVKADGVESSNPVTWYFVISMIKLGWQLHFCFWMLTLHFSSLQIITAGKSASA